MVVKTRDLMPPKPDRYSGYSHNKDVQRVEFSMVWWPIERYFMTSPMPHCRAVRFEALAVKKVRGYEVHNVTALEMFPYMRRYGLRRFMDSLEDALGEALGSHILGLSPSVVDWEMMVGGPTVLPESGQS